MLWDFFDNLFKRSSPEPTVSENPKISRIKLDGTTNFVVDNDTGDREYIITFRLDKSFKAAKSHAAEVVMLHIYSPDSECGCEGDLPYIAIRMDDDVYCAVEEFKSEGDFMGAIDLVKLTGRFYFKAKMEYVDEMMYFYGMDRCGGFWENNGLCLVYPKELVGTDDEKKLMSVLDEAAESYTETVEE